MRGEPAGEDRPGSGPAAGTVRRDFWGLLVSEVVRGLKVPIGWSEGKDWALATKFEEESFCGGRKAELSCKDKEGQGTLDTSFLEAGLATVAWTRAGASKLIKFGRHGLRW